MIKSLLITRPEFDASTYYLSKWSEKIISEAREKNINVIDLYREKANKKRVIGILEKRCPKLVVFNGHGSDFSVCGHDNKIILDVDDKDAVKNKIIYARSCRSAKILGKKAITQGATAFLGYREDFILMHNADNERQPIEDKTAELFLGPSNHIPISLIKGHSVGQADIKSKSLFRKNIEKLIIAGPASDDYYAIRYLRWDMINQICLGDQDAIF